MILNSQPPHGHVSLWHLTLTAVNNELERSCQEHAASLCLCETCLARRHVQAAMRHLGGMLEMCEGVPSGKNQARALAD
jgi:hypothetical protein